MASTSWSVCGASTDTGQRVDLEDAAAHFGIELDELDDDEDDLGAED